MREEATSSRSADEVASRENMHAGLDFSDFEREYHKKDKDGARR